MNEKKEGCTSDKAMIIVFRVVKRAISLCFFEDQISKKLWGKKWKKNMSKFLWEVNKMLKSWNKSNRDR